MKIKVEIEVYVKDPDYSMSKTVEEIEQDEQYFKCIRFLLNNVKDSKVISRILKDLVIWQEDIIKELSK